MRDPESGYYSAAVVDFDGNSIEAVYRPKSSSSRCQTEEPALKVIKNGSVVSRAKSTKTESVAPARSEVRSISSKTIPAIENSPSTPTSQSSYEYYDQPTRHLTYPAQEEQQQQQSDNGSKAAKTIIGTLLGATAGAAIAYAIVKESQSSQQQQQQPVSQPPPQYYSQPATAPSVPATTYQEPPSYRALEAPPPARSFYSAKDDAYSTYSSAKDDAYSTYSRSVASKNPCADTVYEETEYYPPNGDAASVYSQQSGVRRSSSGSVYATKELPIRTIEYPPPARSQTYPCNPPTLISSYVEQSRHGSRDGRDDHSEYNDAETEFSSISTIKPPRSSHSHYSSHSKASHHSSHHSHHSSPRSVASAARESRSQAGSATGGSVYSTTRSARNVPLPESVYSNGDNKSVCSARDIPLPESATPSTVFLDTVDIDTHITPDDSISQVGENRSHHSRHSSRHSKSGASHVSHSSKRSKFDEPVKPSDSISQVSTNVSRASERTVKASGSGSKAPSQAPSKAPSKAPSQAPSKAGSKVSSSSHKTRE